jgi:hypothetical protein
MNWSARSVFKSHLRSFTHTPHPRGTSKEITNCLKKLICPRLRLLAELAVSDELIHDDLRLSTRDSTFLSGEVKRLGEMHAELSDICGDSLSNIESRTSGTVPESPCPDRSTIGQAPTGVSIPWSICTTGRSAFDSEFRRNFATRTMLHTLRHLQHAASKKDQEQMMGDFM